MQLEIPPPRQLAVEDGDASHIYRSLPYRADGSRDHNASMTLDLRQGAKLRIVNQQSWDERRWGNIGIVLETQTNLEREGHYAVRVGTGPLRVLGKWWISAA